jgi:hypothetical protein
VTRPSLHNNDVVVVVVNVVVLDSICDCICGSSDGDGRRSLLRMMMMCGTNEGWS